MPDTIEIFNRSLERCVARPEFLRKFYDRLINSSPEIAKKFAQTDFAQQTAALKRSLYVLLFAYEWKLTGDSYLEGLAARHSRGQLDVRPELYDIWLDCLMKTVKEFDERFDEATERAWRKVLAPGIRFFKSRY